MKRHSFKQPINTREASPRVRQDGKNTQLLCPFCVPTHALVPGQQAQCGTTLRLLAVQTIIPVRTVRDKKLVCVKCGQTEGGSMVPFHGQYLHLNDCKPGTAVYPPEQFEYSRLAERVFKMKILWIKKMYEKRYGRAEAVKEIDPQTRERTGKILGYVFMKV